MMSSSRDLNDQSSCRIDAPEEPAPAPHERRDPEAPNDAVATFVIEVSAGRPHGAGHVDGESYGSTLGSVRRWLRRCVVGVVEDEFDSPEVVDATEESQPRGSSRTITNVEPQSRARKDDSSIGPRQRLSPKKASTASSAAESVSDRAAKMPVEIASPLARRPRRGAALRRNVSVWSGTLLLHAALVLALSLVSIARVIDEFDLLLVTDEPFADEIMVEAIEFNAKVTPAEFLDDVAEEVELTSISSLDDAGASLGEVSAAAALSDVVGPGGVGDGELGDVGGMFAGEGLGLAGDGLGRANMPSAEFFGERIEGRRIVFVLDNSGSMQGGRLETVIAELKRCVDLLTPQQMFYVVFYSDAVYPLFYPDPALEFVRPTPQNKELLARWLDTVELCLGDSIDAAVAAAASIEPDTVFLLSDGRVQSEKKLRYLLAAQTRSFPIHTVAVGMGRGTAGREKLALIAETNGGSFRESEIAAEMKTLALRKPRPYHNDAPGMIWGRNVKAGGWGMGGRR